MGFGFPLSDLVKLRCCEINNGFGTHFLTKRLVSQWSFAFPQGCSRGLLRAPVPSPQLHRAFTLPQRTAVPGGRGWGGWCPVARAERCRCPSPGAASAGPGGTGRRRGRYRHGDRLTASGLRKGRRAATPEAFRSRRISASAAGPSFPPRRTRGRSGLAVLLRRERPERPGGGRGTIFPRFTGLL